jgi:hypothetical protein
MDVHAALGVVHVATLPPARVRTRAAALGDVLGASFGRSMRGCSAGPVDPVALWGRLRGWLGVGVEGFLLSAAALARLAIPSIPARIRAVDAISDGIAKNLHVDPNLFPFSSA